MASHCSFSPSCVIMHSIILIIWCQLWGFQSTVSFYFSLLCFSQKNFKFPGTAASISNDTGIFLFSCQKRCNQLRVWASLLPFCYLTMINKDQHLTPLSEWDPNYCRAVFHRTILLQRIRIQSDTSIPELPNCFMSHLEPHFSGQECKQFIYKILHTFASPLTILLKTTLLPDCYLSCTQPACISGGRTIHLNLSAKKFCWCFKCVNILKPSCEPVNLRNLEKSVFSYPVCYWQTQNRRRKWKTTSISKCIKLLLRRMQVNFFGLFASLYVQPTHSPPLPACPPSLPPKVFIDIFSGS